MVGRDDARRALRWTIALIVACASLAGCSSPFLTSIPDARLRDSGAYDLVDGLQVPEVRGVEGCGAQALGAILAWTAPGADAAALADGLPWHDLGATPVDLLLAARDHGRRASIVRGSWASLRAHAEAGEPVLVMIDAGPERATLRGPVATPVMHWSVVSGAARDGTSMLLGAPDARHHRVEREAFMRRWDRSDRCLIVVSAAPAR